MEVGSMSENEKKFIVNSYMLIDKDDDELLTFGEAVEEVEQQKLLQSENIYKIININTGDEVDLD